MVAEADIIVGPLFSDAVVSARQVAATHGVPMLALSNNTAIAGRGSWLFGYLPEQQVDILLGHALTAGRNKVGIIAADDAFGQRLARHARKRLGQFGLEPEDFVTLTAAQLASEDQLKNAVKRFTGYTPPADDEDTPAASELPPPRYEQGRGGGWGGVRGVVVVGKAREAHARQRAERSRVRRRGRHLQRAAAADARAESETPRRGPRAHQVTKRCFKTR